MRSHQDFVPHGGTYRFTGKLPPPPVRPAYAGHFNQVARIAPAAASSPTVAWGQPGKPPQVLVMTSRLPRLACRYAGIAYKLSLMMALPKLSQITRVPSVHL